MSVKNITNSKIENILVSSIKKIRAERIALNLTQKEFARLADIKYATYRSFEQKGNISFENYIKILIKLNKIEQFDKFLDGFEFNEEKKRVCKNSINRNELFNPLIKVGQKHISLDKNIFGTELFYSVGDGHIYEVPTFITIVLSKWTEKRVMLLVKYFGEERLKPYILKQKDAKLLKSFHRHIQYIESKINSTDKC